MKKHLFIVIVAVAMLAACKNEKNEKALAGIKDLRVKLAGTDSILASVDRSEIDKLESEVKNNSQFIQFNVGKVGDTLDFKTALLLTDYRALRKQFAGYSEDHKRLTAAVDSASKSLDNLEHDLMNNTLAEGLTPEGSLKQEEEQVNQMYDFALDLRSGFTAAKLEHDTLAPKISDYMRLLNEKLATQQSPPNK
jgi:hypothetical protein